MVKYGLDQVDLNRRASLALAGMSESPERDIAELLQSGQPIEVEVREKIARALRGQATGINLKAKLSKETKFYRRLRKNLIQIRIGEIADDQVASLGYAKAIKTTSKEYRTPKKTVEAHVTLSRKARKWAEGWLSQNPDCEDLTIFELKVAFVYALLKEDMPENWIKPSLQELCSVLDDFDQAHRLGSRSDGQPKNRLSIR